MQEVKVGLLVLLAAAVTVYMSFRVTSQKTGFGEFVTYRAIASNASGIFPKTPIKMAGIDAGRIIGIELSGNNSALISFEVAKQLIVSKASRLRVKTVGFLGDKYLELVLEDNPDERLKELSFVPMERRCRSGGHRSRGHHCFG